MKARSITAVTPRAYATGEGSGAANGVLQGHSLTSKPRPGMLLVSHSQPAILSQRDQLG